MTVMADAPTLEATIDRMARLPEREFRQIVDRDLRRRENEADEVDADAVMLRELESQALRSPALVDRWLTALLAASKSVEGQLSARKMDYDATKSRLLRTIERLEFQQSHGGLNQQEEERLREARDKMREAKERYSKSRSGTLRFKSGLDEWVIEARNLRDSTRDRLYDTVVVHERNRFAARAQLLEEAIQRHRDAFPEEDDPTDADEELWSLVR